MYFIHRETNETKKNKAKPRKMGLRFFPVSFHDCFSFIVSQNAYHALILDHL